MTTSGSSSSASPAAVLPLQASREEWQQCQFSSWFSTFRYLDNNKDSSATSSTTQPATTQEPPPLLVQTTPHANTTKKKKRRRTNVTIQSVVISPLPLEFVAFLQADGIRLPKGATALSSCAPNEKVGLAESSDSESDVAENKSEEEDQPQFSFLQLNDQIAAAIQDLGGAVVPKLNWSAPKDATWINEGTLKCKTPGDVYLLLKSSDFCLHDLQTLQELIHQDNTPLKEEPLQLQLVLRKWCNFYPSMEFRCFVRDQTLLGISQRIHSQHYPHLLYDRMRLRALVLQFFDTIIAPKAPHSKHNNHNYVFDIYIDKSDRVWLLDFNVWSLQTDALLYSWDELVHMEIPESYLPRRTDDEIQHQEEEGDMSSGSDDNSEDDDEDEWPEFRIVENALEVLQDPLASYRAPVDTVALAASAAAQQQQQQQQQDGGGSPGFDPTTFEAFMAMCQKPSERGDGDGNDGEGETGDDSGSAQ